MKRPLIFIMFIGLLLVLLFFTYMSTIERKDAETVSHWQGKMHYYNAMNTVLLRHNTWLPDSIEHEIELEYIKKSKEGGFEPYFKRPTLSSP